MIDIAGEYAQLRDSDDDSVVGDGEYVPPDNEGDQSEEDDAVSDEDVPKSAGRKRKSKPGREVVTAARRNLDSGKTGGSKHKLSDDDIEER